MQVAQKTPVSKLMIPQKHLLSIEHLNREDIQTILDLSEYYVVQNRRRSQTNALLKGLVMINVFLENSTRTRLSFEMAAKRLGADVINMTIEGSSMKKGESFTDTLKTINAMRPDLFVLRHNTEGSAEAASQILDCPVMNAGDGTREHPTQALLDALTLRRHFGRLEGLNVAIVGDILHSRVAHSNLQLFKKMGVNVKCVGPAELMPLSAGGTQDMKTGLTDAEAVMVLRIQKERLQKSLSFTEEQYFDSYGLTAERLGFAREGAVVLHPGPMNRGVEIDASIADDPKRSLITAQVEMGVAVRMACLDLLTRSAR
ncbi:MAG: aspartate carbamoyltransferase [Alphaproteobacteria bacterium]|jgi:aspartate carbamoyltransferase catalytic subunit|nr:aspartate carbamoyltransferase [Alphaproteobacteria bacterium]